MELSSALVDGITETLQLVHIRTCLAIFIWWTQYQLALLKEEDILQDTGLPPLGALLRLLSRGRPQEVWNICFAPPTFSVHGQSFFPAVSLFLSLALLLWLSS